MGQYGRSPASDRVVQAPRSGRRGLRRSPLSCCWWGSASPAHHLSSRSSVSMSRSAAVS